MHPMHLLYSISCTVSTGILHKWLDFKLTNRTKKQKVSKNFTTYRFVHNKKTLYLVFVQVDEKRGIRSKGPKNVYICLEKNPANQHYVNNFGYSFAPFWNYVNHFPVVFIEKSALHPTCLWKIKPFPPFPATGSPPAAAVLSDSESP